MKYLMTIMFALLANCLVGSASAHVLGADPLLGCLAVNGVSLVLGGFMPHGSLLEGVAVEIWTGEMVKKLRAGTEGSWLDGIPDNSSIVNNDVIHLVDVGVDPKVIINNTTYPIPVTALNDSDIAVSLDKFQTEVTPITDDELYTLSYDKMSRVKESHSEAITEAKFKKAAHAIAPLEASAGNIVLKTTGGYVDDTKGRRRLTRADIIRLKGEFDKLKVPVSGRRLVLCPDHVSDLLLEDQKFADQYYNYVSGKISNLYGFEVYEYVNCPLYSTAGKKKALDAAASTGEYQASFAFFAPRVFKASGSTKMYYSEASTDPEYQRNKINFRHYFLAMPKKSDCLGCIMSEYKAS